MPIRLTAQSGQLPLAFQNVDEHLKGLGEDAYLHHGQPLAGDELDARLAREGSGLHPLTLYGQFAQSGYPELFPWSTHSHIAGRVDTESLARVIHAMTRQFIAPYGKGNTPPEIYVTGIQLGFAPGGHPPIDPPPEPPKRRRGGAYVGFVDSKTGRYVEPKTYKHSRRALKAAAKRKGRKTVKRGRYVRVLIPYDDDDFGAED